jgi:hypothetical protein
VSTDLAVTSTIKFFMSYEVNQECLHRPPSIWKTMYSVTGMKMAESKEAGAVGICCDDASVALLKVQEFRKAGFEGIEIRNVATGEVIEEAELEMVGRAARGN